MISFKQLFGQKNTDIKKFCVLAPFYDQQLLKVLGVPKLRKGTIYASGNSEHLSLIHTRMGATFLGDAVLYLEDSPCQYLVLLGACGATGAGQDHLDIGQLTTPRGSYAVDSFSQTLSRQTIPPAFFPADNELLDLTFRLSQGQVRSVEACCSFASFALEPEYSGYFERHKINILDMETAALFQAATVTQKKAAALLYVTDILNVKHAHRAWSVLDKIKIQKASQKAGTLLKGIAQHLAP